MCSSVSLALKLHFSEQEQNGFSYNTSPKNVDNIEHLPSVFEKICCLAVDLNLKICYPSADQKHEGSNPPTSTNLSHFWEYDFNNVINLTVIWTHLIRYLDPTKSFQSVHHPW